MPDPHPTPWTVVRIWSTSRARILDANEVEVLAPVDAKTAKRIARAINLAAVVEAAVDVYRECSNKE